MLTRFRLTQISRIIAAVVLVLPAVASGAQTDWRDLESRVQYAWYTEDARDLVALTVGNAYLLCIADTARIEAGH